MTLRFVAWLGALVACHDGREPAETQRVDGTDGTFAETHRRWRNDSVELEISVHEHRSGGVRWFVTEQWSRRVDEGGEP